MATPDLQPSRGLQRAVSAELERVERARARAHERRQSLVEELKALDRELAALAERGALLAALRADEGDVAPRGAVVQGRRIAEVAARLLAERGVDHPIHYRAWYSLLEEAGYVVAARDPLASFLTNVSRSPLVRRAGRAGHYELDREAPTRLQARRAEVEAELDDLRRVRAERGPDPGLDEHEGALQGEVAELERKLDEIIRVLGEHLKLRRAA